MPAESAERFAAGLSDDAARTGHLGRDDEASRLVLNFGIAKTYFFFL